MIAQKISIAIAFACVAVFNGHHLLRNAFELKIETNKALMFLICNL